MLVWMQEALMKQLEFWFAKIYLVHLEYTERQTESRHIGLFVDGKIQIVNFIGEGMNTSIFLIS
jgi:hypothetical protein